VEVIYQKLAIQLLWSLDGDNHKFNNNSLTNKWALQTATEVV